MRNVRKILRRQNAQEAFERRLEELKAGKDAGAFYALARAALKLEARQMADNAVRALEEARLMGLPRVFLLTYKPDYFKKFQFRMIDKSLLPHKVWTECINCPKFPDCGEVAMIQDL